jgi:hypothetical protein
LDAENHSRRPSDDESNDACADTKKGDHWSGRPSHL